MHSISITVNDPTINMVTEIAEALRTDDGCKPSRSQVVRLAIAAMRKRMSDEGLLEVKSNG